MVPDKKEKTRLYKQKWRESLPEGKEKKYKENYIQRLKDENRYDEYKEKNKEYQKEYQRKLKEKLKSEGKLKFQITLDDESFNYLVRIAKEDNKKKDEIIAALIKKL